MTFQTSPGRICTRLQRGARPDCRRCFGYNARIHVSSSSIMAFYTFSRDGTLLVPPLLPLSTLAQTRKSKGTDLRCCTLELAIFVCKVPVKCLWRRSKRHYQCLQVFLQERGFHGGTCSRIGSTKLLCPPAQLVRQDPIHSPGA